PSEHKDRTADAPAELARMRAAFAAEAPAMRDAPVSVLHLRLAPDQRPGPSGQPTPHTVEGTLRTEGTIAIRAVAGAEPSPLDAHAVRLTLRGPALGDLVVDPPSARIELELRKDGSPLDAHELLLGPFGLPMLAPGAQAVLAGATLTWLDAARAPVLGER